MLLYLDYIAIISFVLFIIMLVVRLRRIRRTGDYGNAGHFTVFFSWLLIIVFFVSISGIAYGAARPAQFNQLTSNLDHHLHSHAKSNDSNQATQKNSSSQASKSSDESDSSSSSAKTPNVVWSPHDPEIADGSSVVRVRFLVPANTSVTVKGHLHHQRYGYVPADDQKQDVTLKFTDAGKYDVVINHGGKTYTKQLEVN